VEKKSRCPNHIGPPSYGVGLPEHSALCTPFLSKKSRREKLLCGEKGADKHIVVVCQNARQTCKIYNTERTKYNLGKIYATDYVSAEGSTPVLPGSGRILKAAES
jgi:hypothetical protein